MRALDVPCPRRTQFLPLDAVELQLEVVYSPRIGHSRPRRDRRRAGERKLDLI